ncbi:hypothetical protein M9194_18690 [Vibrio sp. S4M6]|uniref:hypothetical protein n=1 Tax=Vibrio sinus TaxID=2946865 RepID=UPI00202A19C8|nr:hypothetical protein [Vibrio sinus]MCL9783458.1 hypothetical protein [Vibrio sinus]
MPSTETKTCSCDHSTNCVYTVQISSKDFCGPYQDYYFKQDHFVPSIDAVDKNGTGVNMTVTIGQKSTGCVTKNPYCGGGRVLCVEGDGYHKSLKLGVNNVFLKSPKNSYKLGPIKLLQSAVFGELDCFKPHDFRILIGECGHEDITQQWVFSDSGKGYTDFLPSTTLIDTAVHVYPKVTFKCGVKINFDGGIEERTDKERRDEQIENYKAQDKTKERSTKKMRKGWRNGTKELTTNKSISWNATSTLEVSGQSPIEFQSRDFKKDFISKKNKSELTLLDKPLKVIDSIKSLLKTGDDPRDKFPLLEIKTLLPSISIDGKRELQPYKDSYYLNKQFSLGFSPLIGASITLDLLSALADYLHAGDLVSAARESISCETNATNCADIKCILLASFVLNFKIDIDNKNNPSENAFNYNLNPDLKINLALESNLSAKYKYWIASGVFTANANVEACGHFNIEKNHDHLTLVLSRDAVTAKISEKYKQYVGKSNTDKKERTHAEKTEKYLYSQSKSYNWTLLDALPEEQSDYRVNFYI